jgi:hypothetical protein
MERMQDGDHVVVAAGQIVVMKAEKHRSTARAEP